MTISGVKFAPEALEQLDNLEQYIAEAASSTVAAGYIDAIVSYCESLQSFPNRGTQRDDIRPGLRITNYRGRTVNAFAVEEDQPYVIGVFYGGQDYATALADQVVEECKRGEPLNAFWREFTKVARQGPRLFFAPIARATKENTPKVGSMSNFWGAVRPAFAGTAFLSSVRF